MLNQLNEPAKDTLTADDIAYITQLYQNDPRQPLKVLQEQANKDGMSDVFALFFQDCRENQVLDEIVFGDIVEQHESLIFNKIKGIT